jgi:hypothetical protein
MKLEENEKRHEKPFALSIKTIIVRNEIKTFLYLRQNLSLNIQLIRVEKIIEKAKKCLSIYLI